MLQPIKTDQAPAAIGSYSQAIKVGQVVYLSGQIPLDPQSMKVVEGDITAQIIQVFENLKAVAEAAGGSLDNIVRLTVYLIHISDTPKINEIMKTYFKKSFPARTTIGVAALPLQVSVEIDAMMVVEN